MAKRILIGILLQFSNIFIFGPLGLVVFYALGFTGIWNGTGLAALFIIPIFIYLGVMGGIFTTFLIIAAKVVTDFKEAVISFLGCQVLLTIFVTLFYLLDPSISKDSLLGSQYLFLFILTFASTAIAGTVGYLVGVGHRQPVVEDPVPVQQGHRAPHWLWIFYLAIGAVVMLILSLFSIKNYITTKSERSVETLSNLGTGPYLYIYSGEEIVGSSFEPAIAIVKPNGDMLKKLLLGGKVFPMAFAMPSPDNKFLILIDRKIDHNNIGVVDTANNSFIKQVSLESSIGLASILPVESRSGQILIPTNKEQVVIFDTHTMMVSKIINLQNILSLPDNFRGSWAISADGKFAFVSYVDSDNLKLVKIDLTDEKMVLETTTSSREFATIGTVSSSDGEMLYQVSYEASDRKNYLNIISLSDLNIKYKIPLPDGVVNYGEDIRVDGTVIYLLSSEGPSPVYAVDVDKQTVSQKFSLGSYPSHFWIGKDVVYSYVSSPNPTISLFDKDSGQKTSQIKLDQGFEPAAVFEIGF